MVISHSFDMGAVDSDRNEEFDALLDFIAWIERKRPAATLFVAGKIATLFNMPGHEMNEHLLYRTVIQRCSCLLHLGFEECARTLFKLDLPQSADVESQTDARQGYVQAQLFYREDYYREAHDIAKYALRQSEEEEEKREIEELLHHISAAIDINQQEWLEGTHVHQTEQLAVKQNECQQRHVTQPRHRRPKCRQPTKLEPKASARMVEGKSCDTVKQKENAKQLPVSSPNTSWEQSISCTIRTVSKSSSTAGNRNSTRHTVFAETSLSDGVESEEDDIEDNGYDLENKCFNFTQHDFVQEEGVTGDNDWVGNVEETSLILPSGTADEEAQGWFQRSVQCGASAQQRYIHISPKQLKQYERPGKRESRYTDLEKDESTLEKLMADCPGKYKRCHLQIKSSHHAVAKVVGKHDSCTEIQIDGRSRIGRTFMDDEVVVELL
ncbi:uncharacterized protein, partial [Littorina saxatilis]|uniref:uncharacterized protein n=1 Tax=Littorina saxatilis TaxID=31220 RepID=UPI0038B5565A